MTSTFTSVTEQRLRFLSTGYIPIPVATPDPKDAQSGQKPALAGWSEINHLGLEEVTLWAQRYLHAMHTGIFCGLRNGPKARTFDRLIVYAPVDLRAWASEKVGGPVSTTSQY